MASATFLGVPLTEEAWCPEPEWVTEAVLDRNRIIRVASSDSSLKVVGYSVSATRHIKAWIWPWDLDEGTWLIGSATAANSSDVKRYKEVL